MHRFEMPYIVENIINEIATSITYSHTGKGPIEQVMFRMDIMDIKVRKFNRKLILNLDLDYKIT